LEDLVSLWDILNIHLKSYAASIAAQFGKLAHYETEFEKNRLWIASAESVAQRLKSTERFGQDFLPDEKTRQEILYSATELADIAKDCGLSISPAKIASLIALASKQSSSIDLQHRMRDVRETMTQELNAILFLRASSDMIKFLNKKTPFGGNVAKAFPQCVEDIEEAHQCFALERYTASMFHLGRAMEIAVKAVARKMGAAIPSRDEWQKYLDAMNAVIKAMQWNTSALKKKRAIFSEAAGFFLHFKEAWRNPTAHPKKTYTRQQASDVLDAARSFLDSAARNIFKVKN
jgi:HEPN domain-containing protein